MIKVDWDGGVMRITRSKSSSDYDVEQEEIDQDMLAELHAEHMDPGHECAEHECPYWQPDE